MNDDDFCARLQTLCPTILREGSLWVGFECPTGWETIVEDLSVQIEAYAKEHNPELMVAQVKSKFGGLRYYMSSHNDYVESLINDAETKSFKTCELCGEPGKSVTRQGWVNALCARHAE